MLIWNTQCKNDTRRVTVFLQCNNYTQRLRVFLQSTMTLEGSNFFQYNNEWHSQSVAAFGGNQLYQLFAFVVCAKRYKNFFWDHKKWPNPLKIGRVTQPPKNQSSVTFELGVSYAAPSGRQSCQSLSLSVQYAGPRSINGGRVDGVRELEVL